MPVFLYQTITDVITTIYYYYLRSKSQHKEGVKMAKFEYIIFN